MSVPTFGDSTTVHLFQFGGRSEPRVMLAGQAYTLGQASDIARAVLQLVAVADRELLTTGS